MVAQQASGFDDLVRAVERHHEQYINSLRALHGNVSNRRRERSDTQNTVSEAFLPPVRGPTGPVFSADSSTRLSPGQQRGGRRSKRLNDLYWDTRPRRHLGSSQARLA